MGFVGWLCLEKPQAIAALKYLLFGLAASLSKGQGAEAGNQAGGGAWAVMKAQQLELVFP